MRRTIHRIQPVTGAELRAIAAAFAALLIHCSDVDCPHYTDEINDRCVVKQPDTADE